MSESDATDLMSENANLKQLCEKQQETIDRYEAAAKRSLILITHLQRTKAELLDALQLAEEQANSFSMQLDEKSVVISRLNHELSKKEKEFSDLKVEAEARRQALLQAASANSQTTTVSSGISNVASLSSISPSISQTNLPTVGDDKDPVNKIKSLGGRMRSSSTSTSKVIRRLLSSSSGTDSPNGEQTLGGSTTNTTPASASPLSSPNGGPLGPRRSELGPSPVTNQRRRSLINVLAGTMSGASSVDSLQTTGNSPVFTPSVQSFASAPILNGSSLNTIIDTPSKEFSLASQSNENLNMAAVASTSSEEQPTVPHVVSVSGVALAPILSTGMCSTPAASTQSVDETGVPMQAAAQAYASPVTQPHQRRPSAGGMASFLTPNSEDANAQAAVISTPCSPGQGKVAPRRKRGFTTIDRSSFLGGLFAPSEHKDVTTGATDETTVGAHVEAHAMDGSNAAGGVRGRAKSHGQGDAQRSVE
eukprot:comp14944_c0_seq1/m.11533 comp14944_c0_seq1/g.11533  ORF comp14944_c0_seq1/g.11533 comp14944_c0_seq1/m.11533 type:complete len:478 (-) comp14944_c0_seq1:95-1528(-)